ncbi:stage III sporulation protein AF [Paenibacillus harenae]|uniref:Stage III sporulation protein AF n=1 Tax=Paenibacillus harenae TaxID=306543 RepID=A0ABT9TXL3_PAEHA|nr:stage III sporulation protein AF [Paenibacillus harenae]MDQ0111641.1 stage III sporulation protein AF [Paenibacillus harenae]
MVAWLSDWLRDIIAIILIAVFVELLLPNKAMLRYVRLVVGLFILLTIMSPILKVLQTDLNTMLDDGLSSWTQSAAEQSLNMQGLSEIQQNAQRLTEKREQEAAKLTEITLEDTIRNELTKRLKAPIEEVDAELSWVSESGVRTPRLDKVTISLRALNKEEDVKTDGQDSNSVKEVQAVAIDINIESDIAASGEKDDSTTPAEDAAEEEGWTVASPADEQAIRSLLAEGWGIAAKDIIVRQQVN